MRKIFSVTFPIKQKRFVKSGNQNEAKIILIATQDVLQMVKISSKTQSNLHLQFHIINRF